MRSEYLLLLSAGYALLTAAICAFELKRTRVSGLDLVSLFIVLFLLQCCLPGIVIYACLPFVDPHQTMNNVLFDRIYSTADFPSALLVFALTAWFVFFFYAFMALGGVAMRRLLPPVPGRSWLALRGSAPRLLVVLSLGLVVTVTSFWLMGDTLVERYANIILLRSTSAVEADALSTNAFLLTQSLGWLSMVAAFVIFERRGRSLAWYFCLACVVIFAALGVSRRAVFIPLLLAYLTLVLFDGRWRLKILLLASIPILLWVAFGKELLSSVAYGGTGETVVAQYEEPISAVLRTASEVGITVVESVGSVGLLDLPPRFGVDHPLSILHGFPVGWVLHWTGLDVDLPDRIVRASTEAFLTPDEVDVPPGLFGQMWLDLRIFGPIVWAFAFAVQLSVVQRVFALTVRTRQATSALVLVTFVVALPINSGTYDFSFTVDIAAVMSCILLAFRISRVELHISLDQSREGAGDIRQIP